MSKHLESYCCTIANVNIQYIDYNIPCSNHNNNNNNNFQNYSNCLNKDIRLDLNIDSSNERVMVVPNEYRENVILTYQVKLVDFTWGAEWFI